MKKYRKETNSDTENVIVLQTITFFLTFVFLFALYRAMGLNHNDVMTEIKKCTTSTVSATSE